MMYWFYRLSLLLMNGLVILNYKIDKLTDIVAGWVRKYIDANGSLYIYTDHDQEILIGGSGLIYRITKNKIECYSYQQMYDHGHDKIAIIKSNPTFSMLVNFTAKEYTITLTRNNSPTNTLSWSFPDLVGQYYSPSYTPSTTNLARLVLCKRVIHNHNWKTASPQQYQFFIAEICAVLGLNYDQVAKALKL